MNEIQVNQTAGTIQFNFEELKKNISEQMQIYNELQFSDEEITNAKKDIATLRKIKSALEDKRKEVKKNYMFPYENFELKLKELTKLIDEPVSKIDKRIKQYEKELKKQKLEEIKQIYENNNLVISEFIKFEQIFKEKWLNSSINIKTIKEEMIMIINKIKDDILFIKEYGGDFNKNGLEHYKETMNLEDSLRKIKYLEEERKELSKSIQINQQLESKNHTENQEKKQKEFAISFENKTKNIETEKVIKEYIIYATENEIYKLETFLNEESIWYERG